MVFLEKKNITKWNHLQQAALETGLDAEKLKTDFDSKAKEAFEAGLEFAKSLNVRGFPTIFFTDEEDNRLKVYGVKPYEQFEQTLLRLYPQAQKAPADASDESVFAHYPTLTLKEFATLTGKNAEAAESVLTGLFEQGKIDKYTSKNGAMWRKKQRWLQNYCYARS
jgi:putative protein-disulfide isomerase